MCVCKVENVKIVDVTALLWVDFWVPFLFVGQALLLFLEHGNLMSYLIVSYLWLSW